MSYVILALFIASLSNFWYNKSKQYYKQKYFGQNGAYAILFILGILGIVFYAPDESFLFMVKEILTNYYVEILICNFVIAIGYVFICLFWFEYSKLKDKVIDCKNQFSELSLKNQTYEQLYAVLDNKFSNKCFMSLINETMQRNEIEKLFVLEMIYLDFYSSFLDVNRNKNKLNVKIDKMETFILYIQTFTAWPIIFFGQSFDIVRVVVIEAFATINNHYQNKINKLID